MLIVLSNYMEIIIVTVFKESLQNTPSRTGPLAISLLPVLGKILVKIILKRFTTIAQAYNCNIPNFQFDFRSHHATTHQLHRVADTISSALETKKYSNSLSGCFESIWHRLAWRSSLQIQKYFSIFFIPNTKIIPWKLLI